MRIIQQTESSFAQNHEPFFNSIDPKRTLAAQDCCCANWPLNPISRVACNELSLARGLVNLLKEKNTGTSAIRMTQRVPVLTLLRR